MDLSEFDGLAQAQEDGIEVKILHPKTGEEMGIVMKIAGPESERQKRFRNALLNERLMKNRNRRVTAAEIEQDALRVSAASIISWSGVEINKEVIELSRENAEMVLTKYPFIKDQIDTAVTDRTVFIKS